MNRVESAVFGDDELDPRTAVLVAAANATGILRAVFGRKRIAERKERLAQIGEGKAVARATQAAVEAAQAAQAAMVVTMLTTTTITSTMISS